MPGGLSFGQDGPRLPAVHTALETGDLTLPPLPDAVVRPLAPGRAGGLVVPDRAELLRGLARWTGKQLGGTGLLVYPEGLDRDALWEWADLGWTLSPLRHEGTLLAFDGPLVRIGGSVTAADGAAAAALGCAEQVVRAMVDLAGGDASLRWQDSEARRQGWFARQQVVHRLLAGERELGGDAAPIFGVGAGLERLLQVRVQVEPPVAPSAWWATLEEHGLLPTGEVVLVEGPDERPEAGFHLDVAGRDRRRLRPLDTVQDLGPGSSFDELFPARTLLPEPPPPLAVLAPEVEPAEAPLDELELPEPEPPPLPPFDPGWVELPGHRPGSVEVFLDGTPVEADLAELAPGILRIQRPGVPHGALLRVDFEPTWGR